LLLDMKWATPVNTYISMNCTKNMPTFGITHMILWEEDGGLMS